ncbi:hypothetical protein CRG98_010455 [Punica granatum]|uniref:Uncharacterized protein n=1 Tax=Punica granatum TaxID=22663 RepID=A0A2I0KKZ7_PUNGR|nr:hypothetical protein CRG98_010455 [Punica granatum]
MGPSLKRHDAYLVIVQRDINDRDRSEEQVWDWTTRRIVTGDAKPGAAVPSAICGAEGRNLIVLAEEGVGVVCHRNSDSNGSSSYQHCDTHQPHVTASASAAGCSPGLNLRRLALRQGRQQAVRGPRHSPYSRPTGSTPLPASAAMQDLAFCQSLLQVVFTPELRFAVLKFLNRLFHCFSAYCYSLSAPSPFSLLLPLLLPPHTRS